MRFGVLGETAVWNGQGRLVRVPELKVRTLLTSLLAQAGRTVSAPRLIDDLWGDEPPGNPSRALQAKVSQLRSVLDAAEPGARDLLVTRAPGYRLSLAPGALDAHRFAELTARSRGVADAASRAGFLTDALALWRGRAFADFSGEPFARAAVVRLEEEWLAAVEALAHARLELGEHAELVGELGELVARHPLRERLRAVYLRALYRGGRQSEALAGYEDLRVRLADELGLDPSPELAELHRAMLRQDAALSAPAVAAPRAGSPVSVLAPPLGDFIGRGDAIKEVQRLLTERRLVTLTGPGGVGKTRLALAVVAELRGAHPDGEWLVELAGSDSRLAEVVAAALGLRDDGTWGRRPEGVPDPGAAGRLGRALAGRRMLLVLDNCEHVVDESATLVELLLRSVPGLTVLTTSQRPLALAGETLWEVAPLDPGSALELFVARAAAAAPGFVLDGTNQAAAEAVCRRLDGIPLALELAASRVRALGVHRLLERLDDRFRLLAAGQRNGPARQQTLRAMIDWSWDLLTCPEQAVLRRLAAHAEGCTLEAAEEVCAGDGVPAEEVLDILARLIDRSLVVAAVDGSRYRLLESVAAYCLERLDQAAERESVQARHLAHYTALAVTADPWLRGPEQLLWLARLDVEGANLRAAFGTALRRDRVPGPDGSGAQDALLLADALAWYWILRGQLGEALRSMTAALALPGGDPVLRTRVGVWRTALLVLTGAANRSATRIDTAVEAYEKALVGRQETEASGGRGRAWAWWLLGHALCETGNILEGERFTGNALEEFRERGEAWGEAAALADRAVQRLLGSDLAGTAQDAERSAELFEAAGDECARLWSVYPLASVAEICGDYARAAELWQRGLGIAQRFGLSPQAVDLRAGLGRTALLTGDLDAARAHHQQARRSAVEIGFRAGEINARLGLALIARRDGQLDEAESHLLTVLRWHREVGLDGANALVLAELGFVAELRGDQSTARSRQQQGHATALVSGDPRALALAMEGLAAARTLTGAAAELRCGALLLGAAAAARDATGAPLPPAERGDVDRVMARLQVGLEPADFEAAFRHGRQLTPQQAMAEAEPGTGSARVAKRPV